MLTSLADRNLIQQAREGNEEALRVFAKRYNCEVSDPRAIMMALRRLDFPSVSAAKRLLLANAAG